MITGRAIQFFSLQKNEKTLSFTDCRLQLLKSEINRKPLAERKRDDPDTPKVSSRQDGQRKRVVFSNHTLHQEIQVETSQARTRTGETEHHEL
jgi:hypothetical protein